MGSCGCWKELRLVATATKALSPASRRPVSTAQRASMSFSSCAPLCVRKAGMDMVGDCGGELDTDGRWWNAISPISAAEKKEKKVTVGN